MLDDQSVENVSKNLGGAHKIRNFYNNIVNPFEDTDITMDTHAIAAGMMTPYANKTDIANLPVVHNFGGSVPGVGGAGGSAKTGHVGTYPIYADAYRQAAKDLGVIPQALQSPTWEAVRETFPTSGKGPKRDLAHRIWAEAMRGRKPQQARERIFEEVMGGEIKLPGWYNK
jgi:hypothetical protein